MNLKEIAEIVNVHESTVSRLTNGKYMETPYGIFELKFFFSSSLNNNFGNDFSSKSITKRSKKLLILKINQNHIVTIKLLLFSQKKKI